MEAVGQPQRWFRDWTIWVALSFIMLPLASIAFLIMQPDVEPYYPGSGHPIAYWEKVQPTNPHVTETTDGTALCMIAGSILAGIALIATGSSKRRFIVIPLLLLSGVLCYFAVGYAFFSGEDTITLYHIDTVERLHHHYHLTGGDVSSLDMPYSRLLIYSCDADDTNCYGQQLEIYGGGWHSFDDASLMYNEDTNQLEVWEDRRVSYTIRPDE